MYKYLLFDLDNTLLDFDKSEKNAFWDTLSGCPLGLCDRVYSRYHEINIEEWKKLELGYTTKEILACNRFARLFREYGFLDPENSAKIVNDIYINKLGEYAFPYPDVTETLKELKGYNLYIITNGTANIQYKRVNKTMLSDYFKYMFISEEIGFEKPNKKYFDSVIKKIGCYDLSQYLVIGDSLSSDIKGAVNSGMDSVWINRNGDNSSLPTYTVSKLSEILEILKVQNVK